MKHVRVCVPVGILVAGVGVMEVACWMTAGVSGWAGVSSFFSVAGVMRILVFVAHDDCGFAVGHEASISMEYGRKLRLMSRQRAYH